MAPGAVNDEAKSMKLHGKSVRVVNLAKGFGGVGAVNGVTFTVREGEVATLLGPSGCGKTTTLR